jgi:hypothetical protein
VGQTIAASRRAGHGPAILAGTLIKAVISVSLGILLFAGCGGPREFDPTQDLINELQNGKPVERRRAATEFRDRHHIPPAAVPVLIAALNDPDKQVRIAVAEALGELGVEGGQYLAALAKARLADKDPAVQVAIEQAMDKIKKACEP